MGEGWEGGRCDVFAVGGRGVEDCGEGDLWAVSEG